jgi:hypothetical protein
MLPWLADEIPIPLLFRRPAEGHCRRQRIRDRCVGWHWRECFVERIPDVGQSRIAIQRNAINEVTFLVNDVVCIAHCHLVDVRLAAPAASLILMIVYIIGLLCESTDRVGEIANKKGWRSAVPAGHHAESPRLDGRCRRAN